MLRSMHLRRVRERRRAERAAVRRFTAALGKALAGRPVLFQTLPIAVSWNLPAGDVLHMPNGTIVISVHFGE